MGSREADERKVHVLLVIGIYFLKLIVFQIIFILSKQWPKISPEHPAGEKQIVCCDPTWRLARRIADLWPSSKRGAEKKEILRKGEIGSSA